MDHSDRECPGCVELALYDCLFHGSGAGSVTGCHVHVTAGGCWADLGHNLCTPSGFFGLTYFLDGLWRDLDPLSGVVVRYSIIALNNSLFSNDPAFPVDESSPTFRKAIPAHHLGHANVLRLDYSGSNGEQLDGLCGPRPFPRPCWTRTYVSAAAWQPRPASSGPVARAASTKPIFDPAYGRAGC